MKSFDEWFSEQGSSPEEPPLNKEFDYAELPATPNDLMEEAPKNKKFAEWFTTKNPLYDRIVKEQEEKREKELEKQILAGPQDAAPAKNSFKEAFPDYEEVWHNNIQYFRIGDMIHWTSPFWGPQKMTLKAMNIIANQYPHLYPRFEP